MNHFTLTLATNLETETRQETYLRLQLNSETQAVISMKQMQEVLSVNSERLTPLPNLPAWVMGLLNQRNRIFWAIDLPQFLGLSPLDPNSSTYNIATVRVDDFPVGLTVQQVYGVIRFSPEAIQSPVGNVASTLEPYLRGCVLRGEEILFVLEPSAIIKGAEASLNQ